MAAGCEWLPEAVPAHVDLRVRHTDAAGASLERVVTLSPRNVGIVVVDVWDSHWDPVAAARVDALVPALNESLDAARRLSMTVIIAAADIQLVQLHPRDEQRRGLRSATPPPFPGNGVLYPAPSFPLNGAHPDQTQVPPDVTLPRSPQWQNLHPALVVGKNDVIIDAEKWHLADDPRGWDGTAFRELYSAASSRGITHLVFVGVHSNWSMPTKSFGMLNMKRAGFTVLMARDLSDAFTANGTDWTQRPPRADAAAAPDEGTRLVDAFIERTFDGSIDSSDWVNAIDRRSYSAVVASEPLLLAYWRFEGPAGARAFLDERRTASAWGDSRVTSGERGVVGGQSLRFNGDGGLVVAPMFREDLPPANPLTSLSAEALTIEAWVMPDGADGWVLGHDGDSPETLDVRFGLRGGRLRLEARGSAVQITGKTPLRSGSWYHIAAVQDLSAGRWRALLDGRVDGEAEVAGSAPRTSAAVLIGATGRVNVADGEPGEAKDGTLLSAGAGGFRGRIDEVAIYRAALSERLLAQHAKMGNRE